MSSCICEAVPLGVVRDAITGIQSQDTRDFWKKAHFNFADAFRKYCAMELAFKNSEAYQGTTSCCARLVLRLIKVLPLIAQGWYRRKRSGKMCKTWLMQATYEQAWLCYFCGNARHPRKNCPAEDAVCNVCQKVGHYFKLYQKRLKPQYKWYKEYSGDAMVEISSSFCIWYIEQRLVSVQCQN